MPGILASAVALAALSLVAVNPIFDIACSLPGECRAPTD